MYSIQSYKYYTVVCIYFPLFSLSNKLLCYNLVSNAAVECQCTLRCLQLHGHDFLSNIEVKKDLLLWPINFLLAIRSRFVSMISCSAERKRIFISIAFLACIRDDFLLLNPYNHRVNDVNNFDIKYIDC